MTELELGIENCRRKLRAHGLLGFVLREDGSGVGRYHFLCTDIEAFRAALVERGFTPPDGRVNGAWQSRERVPVASLHLKHFDGWPETKIQAHIDPHGVGGPVRWLRHLLDYNGYMDVRRIEGLLGALEPRSSH